MEAYTSGSVDRLLLRRVFQLRCIRFQCQSAAVRALPCPMCGEGIGDLLSHLQSSCWQYLGFVVSAVAALAWHPLLRMPGVVASTANEYLVYTPTGATGLWDPLHLGLARPARVHAVVALSAAQYGDAPMVGAFVRTAMEVLARPVMTLPHLLERQRWMRPCSSTSGLHRAVHRGRHLGG